LLLSGCSKDDYPVPNVSFTAYIDIHLPDYSGTAFTVNRDRYGNQIGVAGIIVYRLSDIEYYAFERYCPHDQKINCKAVLADDKSTAVCTCCESEFLILSPTADVVSGPSKLGLKNYRTRIDGPYLVVSN
jgi:nitrite reductase/ring-hydroxylating ferredoxin subunit